MLTESGVEGVFAVLALFFEGRIKKVFKTTN